MMKTLFLAEISSNHNADLPRCLAFVETAARIGCDAVKFQLFRMENLFAPEILERSAMHRARKAWELPAAFLPAIAECCRKHDLIFCCTPFNLQAVDELAPYVDWYKIASYELTWPDLLQSCGASGKPVILSTGMANLDECRTAAEILRQSGCKDLTLLHCVSAYPTRPEDANLAALNTIRDACACKVGWSDHSVSTGVIYQAVFGFQVAIVEFHLDLDGQGAEFAFGHCWLPESMAEVIYQVHIGEKAMGDGEKCYTETEAKERLWRADPEDGLRPFKAIRASFQSDGSSGE